MPVPVPSSVVKTYPARGPMQQFRLKEATAFRCFRCGAAKTSKLITVYDQDWRSRLCNGCYGRLLSVYEIKAGAGSNEEKALLLAEQLLAAVDREQEKEAERLFQLSERRSHLLSSKTIRFLATSDYVSKAIGGEPSLDWSPAIIGLCKAVEHEVVERLIQPLSSTSSAAELVQDAKDKDLGRVAKYCVNSTERPPELGAIAHFLQTVSNSEARRESSTLIRQFLAQLKPWPDSGWLLDADGLYSTLVTLTREFRNRAAHTDDLTGSDYAACRSLVVGESGMIWRLVQATRSRK